MVGWNGQGGQDGQDGQDAQKTRWMHMDDTGGYDVIPLGHAVFGVVICYDRQWIRAGISSAFKLGTAWRQSRLPTYT